MSEATPTAKPRTPDDTRREGLPDRQTRNPDMVAPTRPKLRPIPLADALPVRPGVAYATMSPGQWDALLAVLYADGWVLLELNDHEEPVRAYRRSP
jgi:hypothetical protein